MIAVIWPRAEVFSRLAGVQVLLPRVLPTKWIDHGPLFRKESIDLTDVVCVLLLIACAELLFHVPHQNVLGPANNSPTWMASIEALRVVRIAIKVCARRVAVKRERVLPRRVITCGDQAGPQRKFLANWEKL
jgi:hypothetical protein